jgi:hypothetical protein
MTGTGVAMTFSLALKITLCLYNGYAYAFAVDFWLERFF